MSARLTWIGGRDDGAEFVLEERDTTIGRNPNRDVVFPATEEREVSRDHATIRFVDGRYRLQDDGSRNGTFVNGRRLDGEHELEDGDVIAFGIGGPEARFTLAGEVPETIAAVPPTEPAGDSRPSAEPIEPPGGRTGKPREDGAPSGTVTTLFQDIVVNRPPGMGRTEAFKDFVSGAYAASKRKTRRAMLGVGTLAAIAILGVIGWQQWKDAQLQARIATARQMTSDSLVAMTERADSLQELQAAKDREIDSLLAVQRAQLDSLGGITLAGRARSESLERSLDSLRRLRSERGRFQEIAASSQESVILLYVEHIFRKGSVAGLLAGFGSGFFIDEQGTFVTNKHVLEAFKFKSPDDVCVKDYYDRNGFELVETRVHAWTGGQPFRTSRGRLNFDVGYSTHQGTLEMLGAPPDQMETVRGELTCQVILIEAESKRWVEHSAVTTLPLHRHGSSDLAVLRARGSFRPFPVANTPPTTLDPVMAFGFPRGAARIEGGRALPQPTIGEVRKVEETIQHTAPINPGNSGGPLLNLDGKVVGINTWGLDENAYGAIKIEHALRLSR